MSTQLACTSCDIRSKIYNRLVPRHIYVLFSRANRIDAAFDAAPLDPSLRWFSIRWRCWLPGFPSSWTWGSRTSTVIPYIRWIWVCHRIRMESWCVGKFLLGARNVEWEVQHQEEWRVGRCSHHLLHESYYLLSARMRNRWAMILSHQLMQFLSISCKYCIQFWKFRLKRYQRQQFSILSTMDHLPKYQQLER